MIASVAFIQEFISTLDEKMVRQLCVSALSRGVGSMEYVDSLLIMEDDENDVEPSEGTQGSGGSQPPQGEPTPDWCKCRHCQPMSQKIENKMLWIKKVYYNKQAFSETVFGSGST